MPKRYNTQIKTKTVSSQRLPDRLSGVNEGTFVFDSPNCFPSFSSSSASITCPKKTNKLLNIEHMITGTAISDFSPIFLKTFSSRGLCRWFNPSINCHK